ncbi:MAG TPA: polymer-forming cytoskeletal protein [Chloroflexota bacterium]
MNIRSSFHALALGGALLLVALPSAAMASEVRSGTAAVVAPGETVDDDLFASGQTITIAGRATGDVFAAGQTVVVTGTVDGDLIAAAQQVVIDGTVNGDVRAAASVVTVNGHVGRNVSGLAQQVNISSSARVDGSLLAAGETISAFGPVGRGVTVGGGTVQLGGPVGGKAVAWAENLSLGPNARLAGDLEYYSERQIQTPSGAVAGTVQYHPVQREARQAPVLNGLFDFGSLIWLVGSAILGALVIVLAPRASARAVELGRQQPLLTFGLGLLALCAGPIAVVLIGVTLVGIPLALVLAAAYGLGLMLAWPAMGLVVGTDLARRVRRDQPLPVLGALVVGLIVLHLVTHLPILGGLVAFLGLTFGLGLIVQTFRRGRRPIEPARAAVPVAVPA